MTIREEVQVNIRSGLMEYLELLGSLKRQQEYQKNCPNIPVPVELINMWQDLIPDKEFIEDLSAPVFSADEKKALRDFHFEWDRISDSLPEVLPPLSDLLTNEEWQNLSKIGKETKEKLAGTSKTDE